MRAMIATGGRSRMGEGEVIDESRPRRQLIMDATERLVAKYGYATVTMADIGAACNMSASALYLFFPRKADILAALCIDRFSHMLAVAYEVYDSTPDPDLAFDRLLHTHAEVCIENASIMRIFYREQHNLPESGSAALLEMDRRYVQTWRDYVRGRRPELLPDDVIALVGAGRGTMHSALAHDSDLAHERMTSLLTAATHAAVTASIENRPPLLGPDEPQGDDRRASILAAMAHLVARHGYTASGMTDIGAVAGMSAAALYRFFDGKAEILAALSGETMHRVYTRVEAEISTIHDPLERLRRRQWAHTWMAMQNSEYIAVIRREFDDIPPDTQQQMSQEEEQYMAGWNADLAAARPDLEPAERDARVYAALGAAHSPTVLPAAADPERRLNVVASAGLAALLAPRELDQGSRAATGQ